MIRTLGLAAITGLVMAGLTAAMRTIAAFRAAYGLAKLGAAYAAAPEDQLEAQFRMPAAEVHHGG